MRQKLPVSSRLSTYSEIKATCSQCQLAEETHAHLVYQCAKAKEVWPEMSKWLKLQSQPSWQDWLYYLVKLKTQKEDRVCHGYNSYLPSIVARNQFIFQKKNVSADYITKTVKE